MMTTVQPLRGLGRGFTLIEIMVVVLLTGVVAVIAVPMMAGTLGFFSRRAIVEPDPNARAGARLDEAGKARLAAMKQLWDGAPDEQQRYSRQVLTAYAAARMPVSSEFASDAPELIAAMESDLRKSKLRAAKLVAEVTTIDVSAAAHADARVVVVSAMCGVLPYVQSRTA